jgi:CRP-like cAMP-binding protein
MSVNTLECTSVPPPNELLRKIPLFSDLDDRELSAVAQLVHVKRHRARDFIVQQSDPGGELFVIVSGHLKVVTSDAEGHDTALNIIGPGEVVGEVSLLDGGPRSATVVAVDPSELLVIRREPFLHLLESSPKIAVKLLAELARRLRRLTERAEDIAFLRVGDRLAKRIVALADNYGEERTDGSVRIAFRLSQQEMGDLVGATRESANKQLRAWEARGLLSQESGHLVLHDLTQLRRMGDYDAGFED